MGGEQHAALNAHDCNGDGSAVIRLPPSNEIVCGGVKVRTLSERAG